MPRRGRLVTHFDDLLAVVLLGALRRRRLLVAGAGGETVRQGALQVSFGGSVAPHAPAALGDDADRGRDPRPRALARRRAAARRCAGSRSKSTGSGCSNGRGLPVCPLGRLRASSTEAALAACRPGAGRRRPRQRRHRPARTGPDPVRRPRRRLQRHAARRPPGDPRPPLHQPARAAHLRPRLRPRPRPRHLRHPPRRHRPGEDPAHRPHHLLLLRLHRVYSVDGEERSYLSAGCPAPEGFPTATFPLLRASYGFVG